MGSIAAGNVGFSVFKVVGGPPDDAEGLLEAHALPKLGGVEPLTGFTGWRHVLDREYTSESTRRGGYFTAKLVTAERKIPKSTLDAEIALEAKAVMEAEGKAYLNAQRRKEIKDAVSERLLPEMPWTFKSTEFVWTADGYIVATAKSERARDALAMAINVAFGVYPIALDPRQLAAVLQVDADKWKPFWLIGQGDLFPIESAGREFLMWLWYVMEDGRALKPELAKDLPAFHLDGAVTLVFEDVKTTVSKGDTLKARETVSALRSGKVLRKCNLTLARGDNTWCCKFDADGFGFGSMKLPTTVQFDAHGKFAERVVHIMDFMRLFTELYACFCGAREGDSWETWVGHMRAWVDEKGETVRRKDLNEKLDDHETESNQIRINSKDLLNKAQRAGFTTAKLIERRDQLKTILGFKYNETMAIPMQRIRGEMKASEIGALPAAIALAKDLEKSGGSDIIISCQLVAALEVIEADTEPSNHNASGDGEDNEVLRQAVAVIRQRKRASTSSIQRNLRVGYTRAARIMDLLEERGVVGPPEGAGPRKILWSEEQMIVFEDGIE